MDYADTNCPICDTEIRQEFDHEGIIFKIVVCPLCKTSFACEVERRTYYSSIYEMNESWCEMNWVKPTPNLLELNSDR
ncbi:hypothetical protein [Pseudobacteriovorax antillogorgiicola]|uniref:Uncharacterized protein n=2 Tax=Pseudobacteriovorax antillogorgiicola TaxID=1513793 RepID=A0A1Y6CPQ5_9BACT|nr:hypothetical protein [Pseudobacteriovorax antillogorgiicola]TCS44202.1 hypothetical protein EDD56_1342 [Pseudobacteriovorax antillogorgiicola]SMF80368.1 hypothetical protein SAMN06296036_1353 [Pseudobacteriovorax antillogorgiicola]